MSVSHTREVWHRRYVNECFECHEPWPCSSVRPTDETRPDREALRAQIALAAAEALDKAQGHRYGDDWVAEYSHEAYAVADAVLALLPAPHPANLPLNDEALADGEVHPTPAPHPEGGIGALPEQLRGDGPCSRCGTADNPVWFTESVFWNAVVRSEPLPWCEGDGFMCINCFVRLADERGYRPTGWRLLPEWHWETHDERQHRALLAAAPAPTEAGDE